MRFTDSEFFTAQFYDWERRGRGWDLFDVPVDLEPIFVPFFGYFPEDIQNSFVDDGHVPGILERISNLIFPNKKVESEIEEPVTINAFQLQDDEEVKYLQLLIPEHRKFSIEHFEQFFLALSNSHFPVSFEIHLYCGKISLQLVSRERDTIMLDHQLQAFFPDVTIGHERDCFSFSVLENTYVSIQEMGLEEEFMRPLQTAQRFDLDSYTSLFGLLDSIDSKDGACIQILFRGTKNSWSESTLRSVSDNQNKSFFLDDPEMLVLAKEKVSKPLFSVVVRIAGMSLKQNQARVINNIIGEFFSRITQGKGNRIRTLQSDGLEWEDQLNDLFARTSHRTGMLLNSSELISLAHFPGPSIVSRRLQRKRTKTKAAPSISENGIVLGYNRHEGIEVDVRLNAEQRTRHMHLIGATGSGKSTLLLNLISQDIQNGEGICVLDPHGDLIDSIIGSIPTERIDDVILFDPADADFPFSFNILKAHNEIEREALSSDLVTIFKKLSTSWGDQMNSVFANAIIAILESSTGGTLADLRRFLIDEPFRRSFLSTVNDPSIVYYWKKGYPLLKSSSIGPILTRLDTFLRPKLIRNMVIQKEGLDFNQIITRKKILLVKLSQGLIGVENSYLLGSFIVSKIHQSALGRQLVHAKERNPFYLYIDEFQHFITPSMAAMLSGVRKYGIGLVLANQDMGQLSKLENELSSSLLTNVGIRICFRVSEQDARKLADGFSFFDEKDLLSLERGQAIARIDRSDQDFNLATYPEPEIDQDFAEEVGLVIRNKTRQRYCSTREGVEALLSDIFKETELIDKIASAKPSNKQSKSEEENRIQSIAAEKEIYTPQQKPASANKGDNNPLPKPIFSSEYQNITIKREVTRHRYLQTLIKKMAESRGYIAHLEKLTTEGHRIDVVLEKNEIKIACEVCITTPEDWEIHNIEKCLLAGFTTVITCTEDRKTVQKLKQRVIKHFPENKQSNIHIFSPDEIFAFLDQQVIESSESIEKIKGYRVKLKYGSATVDNQRQTNDSLTKLIADSIKRMKNSD